jgi:hypothetical protein
MPVYHVSNFDVSAVQIDLSSNIFSSTSLSADYWVKVDVSFNSGGVIKGNNDLNDLFFNIFTAQAAPYYAGTASAFRNSAGTRSNIYADATTNTGFQFKDLGVIKSDHSLLSSDIYTNVTDLRAAVNDTTSFVGKAREAIDVLNPGGITGLREKIMASINAETGSDRGINEAVPVGAQFGFKVVRNLNLAGSSQDKQIFIGVVLQQIANN